MNSPESLPVALLFAVLVFFFALLLIFSGLLSRKRVRETADFTLAGRGISGVLNMFGVLAIGFAGTSVSLVPAMAILYGFWPSFLNQLVFSIGGLAVFGIFFTRFIRLSGAHTLPEWLEVRFDRRVRLLITLGTIIGLTGIMANNIVSIAAALTGFIDIPYPLAISIIFSVFLLFSWMGGFWAVTISDFFQLILGLAAIPLILFLGYRYFGGPQWIMSLWPQGSMEGSAGRLPLLALSFPSFLSSLVLFACFLVWGNNYYWLRSASCRNAGEARWSFVAAALLLSLLVYVPLLYIGMVVRAAYPQEMASATFFTAASAYGLFLGRLPALFIPLLLLVPLAAGLSTASTAHIGASSVLIRDIYQRQLRPAAGPRELLMASRLILLLLGALVWVLCFYPGGPVILFAFSTAWLGPPAILLLLGMLWRRFTAFAAFWSALVSIILMSVLTVLDLSGIWSINQRIHVGMAGFLCSVFLALLLTPFSRPAYYGQKNWTGRHQNQARLPQAGTLEAELLRHIARGYSTMSELADISGLDTAILETAVARLDLSACIERRKLYGSGFYHFRSRVALQDLPEGPAAAEGPATPEGPTAADTAPSDQDCIRISGKLIPRECLELAAAFERNPDKAAADLVKNRGYSSLYLACILERLQREGYLKYKGLWKQGAVLTAAGRELVTKARESGF